MASYRVPFTQRLAKLSATYPFRVLVIWLIGCVLMGVYASTNLSQGLTSTFSLSGNYDSVYAKKALEDHGLEPVAATREIILVDSPNKRLAHDPAFASREHEIAQTTREALSAALTKANGKEVHVNPLTLDDLESGEIPTPSVIDRQSILDLIDDEKRARESAFKARGEALATRAEALATQEEILKKTQESIQIQVASGALSPQEAQSHGAALNVQGQALIAQADQLRADKAALDEAIEAATKEGVEQQTKADEFIDSLTGNDNHSSMIIVSAGQPFEQLDMQEWQDTIRAQSDDQVRVTSIGSASIQHEFSRIIEEDLTQAELKGVPITLLVLVVVFGAFIAALNSILLAVAAITGALGLTALVGQVVSLQLFVTNMISMLGLAVGIDYCLFVTERYREERRAGRSVIDAITTAGGTSGMAMTFSGATVILSLLGIMFVPLNVYQSMSLGAVLVVSVAVAAVLTLLPAVLALLGDRINWPARTKVHGRRILDPDWLYGGFFGTLTKISITHPWKVMLASIALLLALAAPAVHLSTGFQGFDSLPRGEVSEAVHRLYDQWGEGQLFPTEIVATTPEAKRTLETLVNDVKQDALVDRVGPIEHSDDGSLSWAEVYLTVSPSDPQSYDWIKTMRTRYNPTNDHHGILIGGQSASELDIQLMLAPTTPLAIAFVLSLSFILLLVAFRSLVVPIKAMIYNLLSVGATYGVMTLVFSQGWGLNILGYAHTPTIEAWLPILLFSVLFGLSMDYHVFILSRMREHYDHTGNNRESVAVGIRSTSRIITGAALIMVVVFMTFSFGSAIQIQQLGFGLAVAVFLDATIIRSLLVPSLMVLMDDWNWWLPRWLHWIPRINIEGAPAQSPDAPSSSITS